MKRQLLIATTALTMVGYAAIATTPAQASGCDSELDRLNTEIMSGDKNYRTGALAGMESEVRQLRDAARIFAVNGNEEACEDVVEGIEDMLEERQAKLNDDNYDRDAWNDRERQRLQNAKSFSAMTGSMTASHLIGADVRNMQNEDLGEVDDVVITSGNKGASYVLVSHGGFLGIGDKQIAVPMSSVKVTPDGDPVVVLNMSEEQLENAPSFDRGSDEVFENNDWRMKNDKYFSDYRS